MLVAEIVVTYVAVRACMRRPDIRDTVASVRLGAVQPTRLEEGSAAAQQVAVRLGSAVTRTLRFLPMDSRCLVQSLVLSRLLAARGISSTLVIAACPKPEFAAHAWVEHAGRPVLSPDSFYDSRLLEM